MLILSDIEKEYPPYLQSFKKNIVREYLQYKILDSIFSHPYGNKLRFIGGTALRIVYGLDRFSEDLDFDHSGLSLSEFKRIAQSVKKDLENEGYHVDISFSGQNAFRCNIRLPELLYQLGLSGIKQEKILIQLDTESQYFEFEPNIHFIQKFEVFRDILVTPIDILLSQKIVTAFNRKRAKGRDFYDILFLFGKTDPNYVYLDQKIGVTHREGLLSYFKKKGASISFNVLLRDLRPFVFKPNDADKILQFERIIQSKLESDYS